MKTRDLLMGLLLAGAGLAVAAAPAVGADSESSGMMIYIDPTTGQLLKEPAPGAAPLAVSPALDNARSTSHQGLVEVPSAVPGGGVKVDLQGRFQSPLIGAIDADGKVRMHHLHEAVDCLDAK
jgi:hypothetical protein